LALYLARQQGYAPGHRLFAEPEMDLAVWAHARQYTASKKDAVAELPESLHPHADLIAPLLPPSLDWGVTSHLQDKALAALDSPISHAWLYQNESKAITEAVIVGRGIPEVRAEVVAATLSCFFALEPKVQDFALAGVIRLAAAEMEEPEQRE